MNKEKFTIGSYVYFPGTKKPVQISAGPNNKGEYALGHGSMLLWVASSKLELIEDKKLLKRLGARAKPRKLHIKSSDKVLSLDLHGCTQVEAKEKLELIIDLAIIEGVSKIEVIHGIGTGKVREAVYDYLSTSKHISTYKQDDFNPGCVIVYL